MTPYPNQPERQSYGGYLPRNPYAGFWRRVLAYVIDGIVVGAVLAAVQAVIDGLLHEASPVAGDGGFRAPTATGWFLVIIVAYWLYFAIMESSSLQATVGKLAVGVRVTDLQGKRISFARATGRWFAKILSSLILDIGFLMVAFTPRKRGLHDYIAGTLVCKVWALGTATAGQPAPPVV